MDDQRPPPPALPDGSPDGPAETRVDPVRELAARFLEAQASERWRREEIVRKRARRALLLAAVGLVCTLVPFLPLSPLLPIGIAALFLLDVD